MSLWLIVSAGVWAGVWFRGSTSRLYCADSGSKRISTAQTRAPNDVIFARWQRPYWEASLFYSGRKRSCVVHLFYSLWLEHTVLQFDPPQKNLSVKILMLTDLIIEFAIRESGEKRSSLEMSRNSWFTWQTWRSRFFVCSFVFNIQQAKFFCI